MDFVGSLLLSDMSTLTIALAIVISYLQTRPQDEAPLPVRSLCRCLVQGKGRLRRVFGCSQVVR